MSSATVIPADIDSLLDTLKSLSCQEEDEEDLKMLEDMLKSNSFQEAKHVSGLGAMGVRPCSH